MTIMPLPTTNLAGKVKKGFMERKAASNVARKGENVFIERKRKRENGVVGANTRFPNENVFFERKRCSKSRKRFY